MIHGGSVPAAEESPGQRWPANPTDSASVGARATVHPRRAGFAYRAMTERAAATQPSKAGAGTRRL